MLERLDAAFALLTLARSEQRIIDPQEDDLTDIVAEAMDRISIRCRERQLRVEATLTAAPLRGNLELLAIAVSNLLDNAVKYSALGGLVQVTTVQVSPGWVALTVGNDGEMLPADQVGLLFEPFQRGRRTRTGSADPTAVPGAGLGLSIVRAVATAHGGSATATARPGGGLTLTLLLPVSR